MTRGFDPVSFHLVLDHVFVFVEPSLEVVASLEGAGFVADFARDHPGQGTSNRLVLFKDNYLELIFLRSRNEARTNPLRLDRRADWRVSGACPFGIGFRGGLSGVDAGKFFDYRPGYGPQDLVIAVHEENRRKASQPLVFTASPARGELPPPPKDWPDLDAALLEHKNGAKGILKVILEGPGIRLWPLASSAPWLELHDRPNFHMTVFVDGMGENEPILVHDLLTLASPIPQKS